MSGKSIVSPMASEDYEAAAIFLENETRGHFGKEFWLDRFEYWWDKNPAMSKDIVRGWVIRCKDGKIGGFLGNVPVKYSIKGQEKTACSITSWYLDGKYKDKSLELLIPFLRQKCPTILLDTTPLEKVDWMFCKLGFISLKREWLKEDIFYPVNIIGFLDLFVEKTISNKIRGFILKLAGLIAIPAIKLYQMILFPRSDKRYTFREIRKFSEEYSLLWLKLREKHPIIALRDETTLNWFFFGSNLLLSSRKVVELRCDDEIIGYVAMKEVEHTLHGKAYCWLEVVDMVILSDQPSAYDIALRGLLWLAKNSEKKVVFVLMNPFVKNIRHSLLRHGFFIKRGKSRFLYKPTSDDADLIKSFNEDFYATPLDGDRCFFP